MRSPLGSLFAKSPVPYVGRSSRVSMPWSHRNDAEAQMRAMGSVGTLFAIVNRTSNAVAQVDWKLYRKAASGLAEDRVEVTRHAALDLWNKPNQFFTRQEFVESFSQHLDLTGEGWWIVARSAAMRAIPLELWPVRPDKMLPVPDPDEFLTGYIYIGPEGQQIPLELDEVIQLRMPNPLDPYRGMGPVQSILTDLDSTRYSAEWNRNFFLNSAEPGGIIEVPEILGDDEFNLLRDRWNEQHKGVANAHRVALLEHGKWVDRKYTMRDMQFVELRSVAREVIREAFGFPKAMLGTTEDVNRANAEAGEVMFARWLVVPRLERIKGALNADLLPMFGTAGQGLEFDYVNPVPDDREADNAELTSRADAAAAMVTAGWNHDDVLDAVGLPRMRFAAPAPAPAPSPALPAPRARMRARAAVPALVNVDDPETTREDWQERLDALLADWQDVTEDQRAELIEQIEQAVEDGAPAELAALTASSSTGAALLEAALIAQAQAAGERMVETAEEQGVTIVAAAIVGVLAADLAAAAMVTAALLASALAVAAGREALRVWAPGAPPAEVADRVREHLQGLSDASLRTELGGAIWSAEGEGRVATLEQAEDDGNGATYFVATETRDRNTCTQCEDIDGDRFDTLAEVRENYPHGGYFACLGTIRCRGTVEPFWSGS